jgi:hypothetical protein
MQQGDLLGSRLCEGMPWFLACDSALRKKLTGMVLKASPRRRLSVEAPGNSKA